MKCGACPSARSQKTSCWNPAMQKQVGGRKVSPGCSAHHSPAPFLYAMMPPQPPHPTENFEWCHKGFWRRAFSFQGDGDEQVERYFATLIAPSVWTPSRSPLWSSVSDILHDIWSYSVFFPLVQPMTVGLSCSLSGDTSSRLASHNFNIAWDIICVLCGLLFKLKKKKITISE